MLSKVRPSRMRSNAAVVCRPMTTSTPREREPALRTTERHGEDRSSNCSQGPVIFALTGSKVPATRK